MPESDPSPDSLHTWESTLAALRRRFPGLRDSVLFCIRKLQQNPELTLRDFRAEAAHLGIPVAGRALHSARALLGIGAVSRARASAGSKALAPQSRPTHDTGSQHKTAVDAPLSSSDPPQGGIAAEHWIRSQLTRSVEILLRAVDSEEHDPPSDIAELSGSIADRAWASLLYYLRSSIQRQRSVYLSEIGAITYSLPDNTWNFSPAASLASAVIPLDSDPAEWHQRIAARTVYYTSEALKCLELLPHDVGTSEHGPAGEPQVDHVSSFLLRSCAAITANVHRLVAASHGRPSTTNRQASESPSMSKRSGLTDTESEMEG